MQKKITTLKKLPSWQSLALGGVITESGNARKYKTGNWTQDCAIWDPKTCIHCLQCWTVCPDSCIITQDGKMLGINSEMCKACGLCITACPTRPNSLKLKKKPVRKI